jgi:sugar fermentation stimulation protein A
MTHFLYQYPNLLPGRLIRRYKRFFAEIELATGEVITAHCPNTGPMTGICIPGNPVYVSISNNPKRKLSYTWELIQVSDTESTWVGVNTGLPNRIVHLALKAKLIPELGDYSEIQPEVPFGQENSRVDFKLGSSNKPVYLEVKNTTWVQGDLALFPDTVTTRGQKHLRELMALLPEARAAMLYFINRGDCPYFAPGDNADALYGQLFREAIARGVEILPCRFDVSPDGIRYAGLAELKL